ncbi:MAG: RNA polymerase sigma factor [Actinomycetota bacterium]
MSAGRHRDSESPEVFFERMFRATYRSTLAYALRRTRSDQDASDVVAETYLVAWRRIDELRRVGEPQAWLYGVAYKVIGNQRRGSRRRHKLAEKAASHPPEQQVDDPLRSVVSADELERVAEAMATLSPRDREVLRLAAWEGLNHREIGVALGIRRSLVRSVLYRARQRLNAALEDARTRHPADPGHNTDAMDREENSGSEGDDDG